MKNYQRVLIGLAMTVGLSGCATRLPIHAADDKRFDTLKSETLTPFQSNGEYVEWLRQAENLQAKRQKEIRAAQRDEDDIIVVTGSRHQASGPNITNVQNAGVDEGDIVKQINDHLVLMQDGRLFSLDIGGAAPKLMARIDIYDHADEDIWYDELLVSGRRLVVTGYHYGKSATEISVFDLDSAGQFSRRGTWYLESEDYYSGDNSATRMIGDTLIFHTQGDVDRPDAWPMLIQKNQSQVQPILRPENIHPPLQRLSHPDLHMVTECKLSQELVCHTRAVMAAARSEWIVTEGYGFLWVAAPRPNWYLPKAAGKRKENPPATLYRFPIGSDRVDAITIDADLDSRFAFELRDDRVLALVSPTNTQYNDGELALLDIPLSEFSQRPIRVSSANLTPLPGEKRYRMNVRFTPDHLIYGNFKDDNALAYVMDLDTRLPPIEVPVPHDIDRLDRVGQNAVLIGNSAGRLNISWLDLISTPNLTDTLGIPNRFETEGRAQALNMRVDPDGSALLGLPTYFDGTDPDGWDYDEEDGADISFARVSAFGQLSNLGPAKGDPSGINPDYECETSCVDWYGNARPFFMGNRIFALIASELIELQEVPGGLVERSRVNLTASP